MFHHQPLAKRMRQSIWLRLAAQVVFMQHAGIQLSDPVVSTTAIWSMRPLRTAELQPDRFTVHLLLVDMSLGFPSFHQVMSVLAVGVSLDSVSTDLGWQVVGDIILKHLCEPMTMNVFTNRLRQLFVLISRTSAAHQWMPSHGASSSKVSMLNFSLDGCKCTIPCPFHPLPW